MDKDTESTRVVFRVWKKPPGGVLALFPDVEDTRGRCSSYEHVGQHGGADYAGCIAVTRPATAEEYKPLARELEDLGYKLVIRKRR